MPNVQEPLILKRVLGLGNNAFSNYILILHVPLVIVIQFWPSFWACFALRLQGMFKYYHGSLLAVRVLG